MATKVFTVMGGTCPFGKECERDSLRCHQCEYYFRAGTGTFFWCTHPETNKPAEVAQNVQETEKPKRKRGRPPGKATKRPVKRRKLRKG